MTKSCIIIVIFLILAGCSPRIALRRNIDNYIHGTVAPGFEEVAEEFKRNFTERKELGAACVVYYRGKKVVDLWGGYRDAKKKEPWQENTLVTVFSTTKGISAMALALLHSRGLLDYDEKVATYWPEFEQNGKEQITVRQLLAHQAGLAAIEELLSLEIIGTLNSLAPILAKQTPAWTPGMRHGYHASSLGYFENELVRRIDTAHRSIGTFLQEELAEPLDLEFYIGLPDTVSLERVAALRPGTLLGALFNLDKMPKKLRKGLMDKKSYVYRAFFNPPDITLEAMKERRLLSIELPSANGTGTVRALAQLYNVLIDTMALEYFSNETRQILYDSAVPPDSGRIDVLYGIPTRFSLGFMKPFETLPFCSSQKAIGHSGLGGSFAFADPDKKIAFAYAPTRLDYYPWNDPRDEELRKALHRCVEKINSEENRRTSNIEQGTAEVKE